MRLCLSPCLAREGLRTQRGLTLQMATCHDRTRRLSGGSHRGATGNGSEACRARAWWARPWPSRRQTRSGRGVISLCAIRFRNQLDMNKTRESLRCTRVVVAAFEISWYTRFLAIRMSSRNNHEKWYGRPIPYPSGPTIRLIFCPPNSPIHGKPLGWLRFGRFLIDGSQEAAKN